MSKHAKSSNGSFHPLSAPDFLPLPQLRDLQLQRLKAIVQRAYDRVALFRKRMDERGLTPAGPPDAGRHRPAALHREDRPARHLPLRPVRQPDEGDRAAARLQRHDRQADRGRLHAGGCAGLDERDAAQLRRLRACTRATSSRTPTATACSPAGWARTTAPRRSGATVIPISGGNTQRQLMVMKDFGVTAICCTPSYFLHLIDQAAEVGVQHQGPAAARRRLRRRAVDRIHAPAHRGGQRHQGLRHLRPVRNHRPGRRHGMPVPGRAAHLRGLLLSRDHRPQDRQALRRTARKASWC